MYITDEDWGNYREIIDSVHDDFNQADLLWKKALKKLDRFKEGSGQTYSDITLKCMIQFNVFRTWPMTKETDAGAIDTESITVFLNNTYLKGLGYIVDNGSFKFDPGLDLFEYKGQRYRSSGETPVSQVNNNVDLFTILILKRLPTNTSEDKY